MSTRDNRAAKRARKATERNLCRAPFPPSQIPRPPDNTRFRNASSDEAEANLRLRMSQARFHNTRMKNRYLDLFTAEDMQDVQMMDEAEVNAGRQRAVLDVALERFYMAIEQLKNTKKVVKKLRRN